MRDVQLWKTVIHTPIAEYVGSLNTSDGSDHRRGRVMEFSRRFWIVLKVHWVISRFYSMATIRFEMEANRILEISNRALNNELIIEVPHTCAV